MSSLLSEFEKYKTNRDIQTTITPQYTDIEFALISDKTYARLYLSDKEIIDVVSFLEQRMSKINELITNRWGFSTTGAQYMNKLDTLFPELPKSSGWWSTIYLEPIVGSGEQIAIAVLANTENEFKVVQAIRSELLDCLYGKQSENMRSMITWVIESVRKEFKKSNSLEQWVAPFAGIMLSNPTTARGRNIDEILKQAIRFTSSLSSLSLDAERSEEEVQPRQYSEQWSRSIAQEIKAINPQLLTSFGQRVKLGESEILTTFGFIEEGYTANFGLLVPSRLSGSLNAVKAKLLDLETFKKSGLLIKPRGFEVIIGTPSDSDPTLTDNSLKKLRDNIDMIGELAALEGIDVFRAESAESAAHHISDKVA